MVGGICDVLDQLNDLPLKIFKKMWRRNKQRKSCMQMQHRSEFFGLCFFFFLILSWITAWIQNAKGFVCSACQSSFYFGPAVVPFRRVRSPCRACGSRSSRSSCLAHRVALAKKHTHEECKECHEVNVMASQ